MSMEHSEPLGVAAEVFEERCIGCGACVDACAYGAVRLRDTDEGSKATLDPSRCLGDGLCGSLCATGAIVLHNPADEELFRQIDSGPDDLSARA